MIPGALLLLLACQPGKVGGADDTAGSAGATDGGASDGASSDGGTSDGGTSDGGTSDGGTSDGGTSDGGTSDGGTSDGGSTPIVAPDFRGAGSHSLSSSTGSADLGDGCTLSYNRIAPTDISDAPVVLYGHGFQRSAANHTEVGEHLASWGLDVVLVDFCHSSLFDVDHEQNGLDMVALADALGLAAPLYAGHSAGGLAALVAAASDSDTVAYVAMDPVDAEDLGVSYAADVAVPAYGVFGESSWCNADANGLTMMSGVSGANRLRVTDADHCDFEGPSDWQCTTFCTGGNDTLSDDEIRDVSRALATAALLFESGVDSSADQWWSSGEDWNQGLLDSGAVSLP